MADSYTKLLMHNNKVSGSTSKVLSYVGTAQLSTAQKKFGTASLLLDGNSDYVTIPDSADTNFSNGDFTIEGWYYFNDTSLIGFFDQTDDASNRFEALFAGVVYFYANFGGVEKAYYTFSWAPSTGIWYHVAFVRYGSELNCYVNGKALPRTVNTAITTLGDYSTTFKIGHRSDGTNVGYLNGYLDEFRISKGIGRWPSNFTPSLFQYVSDQYTCLLCHFDGSNGATTSDDCSGGDESGNNKIVTYVGTAQTSTAQYKFGGSSLLLDGNSDYCTVPDSADWNFGTSNFTIDFWVRFTNIQACNLCGQFTSGGNQWHFEREDSNTIGFRAYSGGYTIRFTTSWTPSVDTWYHVAIIRKGTDNANTDWAIAINGVLKTAGDLTLVSGAWNGNIPDSSDPLQFGHTDTTGYLAGYIDEARISKGIARWISNFSLPNNQWGYEHRVDGVYPPTYINGVPVSKANNI